MLPNHYEILGVPPDATIDEIKAAWKRHLKYWHPDRNSRADADAKAKALNEAHDVLADPMKKADYDRRLADGSVTQPDDGQASRPASDEWQPAWTPPPGRYSARRSPRARTPASSAPPPRPSRGTSWTAPDHSASYDPADFQWTRPSTASYRGRWRYPHAVMAWFLQPSRRRETPWRFAGAIGLRLGIASVAGLLLWMFWPTIVSLGEIAFGILVAVAAIYIALKLMALLGGTSSPKRRRSRRR
jgi:curved DNA-binding protein CbpA